MFAALLGYNPIQMLLGPALSHLPASNAAFLTGHSFFPSLISAPFHGGLDIAFDFAIAACLIAAVASLLRGKRYVHDLHAVPAVAVIDAARPEPASVADAEPVPAVSSVPAEAGARVRVPIAEDAEESEERTLALRVPALRIRRHPR